MWILPPENTYKTLNLEKHEAQRQTPSGPHLETGFDLRSCSVAINSYMHSRRSTIHVVPRGTDHKAAHCIHKLIHSEQPRKVLWLDTWLCFLIKHVSRSTNDVQFDVPLDVLGSQAIIEPKGFDLGDLEGLPAASCKTKLQRNKQSNKTTNHLRSKQRFFCCSNHHLYNGHCLVGARLMIVRTKSLTQHVAFLLAILSIHPRRPPPKYETKLPSVTWP